MTFQYTGSKKRYLHLLPRFPTATMIVEPFAGSAAYAMTHPGSPAIVLAERDARTRAIWDYLRAVSPERLLWLETLKGDREIDVRVLQTECGLLDAERDLFVLMCRGIFTGTMHTWKLHAPSKIDVRRLLLPHIAAYRRIVGVYARHDYTSHLAAPGVVYFVDPPYHDTTSMYRENALNYEALGVWLRVLTARGASVVVTYGDGCADVLPGLPWHPIATRKVRGATRTEYMAVLA